MSLMQPNATMICAGLWLLAATAVLPGAAMALTPVAPAWTRGAVPPLVDETLLPPDGGDPSASARHGAIAAGNLFPLNGSSGFTPRYSPVCGAAAHVFFDANTRNDLFIGRSGRVKDLRQDNVFVPTHASRLTPAPRGGSGGTTAGMTRPRLLPLRGGVNSITRAPGD